MKEPLIAHLYRAATSEIGIVVASSDPHHLRMKLYPLRKQSPEFECLSFVLDPINPSQLWILKRPDHEE